MFPDGTWETRLSTGYAHLQGIVEESSIRRLVNPIGVTIWHFRRLVLTR